MSSITEMVIKFSKQAKDIIYMYSCCLIIPLSDYFNCRGSTSRTADLALLILAIPNETSQSSSLPHPVECVAASQSHIVQTVSCSALLNPGRYIMKISVDLFLNYFVNIIMYNNKPHNVMNGIECTHSAEPSPQV